MERSNVVLVSEKAVIGMEIETSTLRIDPVGNVRDLFFLERSFSELSVSLFNVKRVVWVRVWLI